MTRLNSIAALEGRQQYSARRIRRLRKLSSLAEILPTDDVSKEWRKILNAFHEADIKGEGQTVVIIDSGFDEKNPLIQKSIVMEKCFDFTGEGLSDKNGHGTMVTLTVLACAPRAKIIHLKILDKHGFCSSENLFIQALKRAQQCKATILNLSVGLLRSELTSGDVEDVNNIPCQCKVCSAATSVAFESDASIFAAAGNSGDRKREWFCPASATGVSPVVGLVNGNEALYNNSSLEVVGIGASAVPASKGGVFSKLKELLSPGEDFVGSSFATPLVSGTAVLVREVFAPAVGEVLAPTAPRSDNETFFESNYTDHEIRLQDFFVGNGHLNRNRPRAILVLWKMLEKANLLFRNQFFAEAARIYRLLAELDEVFPILRPLFQIEVHHNLALAYLNDKHMWHGEEAIKALNYALELCRTFDAKPETTSSIRATLKWATEAHEKTLSEFLINWKIMNLPRN